MYRLFVFSWCFLQTSVLSNAETPVENIASRARLVNPVEYFQMAAQEMIYQLEDRGWSSLKTINQSQALNEITHTNILVVGEVNYTNGFLVSIQRIDVTNVQSSMFTRVVADETGNNHTVTTASVRGQINFRDTNIGYDVDVKLVNEDHVRKYTGIFPHTLLGAVFVIERNMNTNATTVTGSLVDSSGGSGVRMQFMPEDDISQVISLTFTAWTNGAATRSWVVDIMQPMMLDIVTNKLDFPDVCFNC